MTTIRLWQPTDSISALTDLLHRAYRPLAEAGMRFVASHQDDDMTRKRISKGTCFVAEHDGTMVGAVNYRPPGIANGTPWYERAGVAYFGQFAVEPALQRTGIGSMLLARVEQAAMDDNARELAFDTSERAAHLIQYYRKRGYRFVEHVQWDVVNYRSIVMSKRLVLNPDSDESMR